MKYFIATGSTCNIMSFDILQNIVENPILKKTESKLKFYDRATMKSIGKYSLYKIIKDKSFKLRFLKLFQQKYLKSVTVSKY